MIDINLQTGTRGIETNHWFEYCVFIGYTRDKGTCTDDTKEIVVHLNVHCTDCSIFSIQF